MRVRVLILAASALLMAGTATAASREVRYGAAPAWVAPSPTPTAAAPSEGAPLRVIYFDMQARLGPDGDETYSAYRIRILAPQALSVGNISATWSPSSDDLTVHSLKIIRDGAVLDVLPTARFQIIQRENNLESAMLDGQLTANVQTPGLQVGDELEFAATIRRRDPTLGDRSNGFMQLPTTGSLGTYRARLLWDDGKAMRWRATPDLEGMAPIARGRQHELVYEMRDPKSAVTADGAPARVNLRRLLQYSSFATWGEVSALVWPLFDKASVLAADSPVRAEAARIAKETADPVLRAEAALRLVQDRIRYVYVGLDGGNYRPASADDTWNRRFGDCKAKTVLLLALLRELGVPAEPVLVNIEDDDGTDERLPTPAAFNHVLVRARVDGKAHWLDGARLGDRRLAALPAPAFRWSLPLRAGPTNLEHLRPQPPALPELIFVLDQDASAGFAVPAKIRAQQVLRGDQIVQMQAQLAAVSSEDAERALKAFWRREADSVEPSAVAWRYDEVQGVLVLSMTGEGKLDWEGDDEDGRSLDIPGAGFNPPNELKRPAEQDQAAPWLLGSFPSYRCWVTTIRLPPRTGKWRWEYRARPVDTRLGGIAYFRTGGLDGGVMRTVMSKKTLQPEIDAAQARELNERLASFDNNISYVFQTTAATADARPRTRLVELDGVDWTSDAVPCSPPARGGGGGGRGELDLPALFLKARQSPLLAPRAAAAWPRDGAVGSRPAQSLEEQSDDGG